MYDCSRYKNNKQDIGGSENFFSLSVLLFSFGNTKEKKTQIQIKKKTSSQRTTNKILEVQKLFQFIGFHLFFWKYKISNTDINEITNVNMITNIKGKIDTNVD